MGTKLVNTRVIEENSDFPSIPPGFESLAPFTLKKVESTETKARYSASANASGFGNRATKMDYDQGGLIKEGLPRGVVRGCEVCSNCQKVTAKWRPLEARRPDLQNAPVFYPTEEEFEDTLNYMAAIRSKAEAYGICRIVPPPSWKPPCPLKDNKVWESSNFKTRIQRVDKLQNRGSANKTMLKINSNNKKKKRRRVLNNGTDHGNVDGEFRIISETINYEGERFGFEPGPEFTLDAFQKYADDFKDQYFRKNDNLSNSVVMSQEQGKPSVEEIEGEYWRMVEKPTEEIEVLYGADLETGVFGSGFPKYTHQDGSTSDMKYVKSGWNLNNFPRLPGSVLSYESSDISGVLVPWLYIGMCFSSFCWHVEDHHLYSMNYMHWGAPKIWYGVPGADAQTLEAAMRKHLPDLFEEQPDLLHKLVTQLSPSILKAEGVPVYRCVQNPGEFVLTFPRAYHAGFNSGFNCAEAVNVAPVDWLPHGQNAIELYCDQGRRTSISHDKLLLGAARDAVKAQWELNLLRKNSADNLRWRDVCGTNGLLSKSLKARVEMEQARRELVCKSLKALKMESTFDATSERECSVCLFDLHLSAAGCHNCSPDRYACLNHVKEFCSCSWNAKFFLFRYDINELNILVEALEGKLSAVYRWAKLDLGLALSSAISKENGLGGKLSNSPGLSVKIMTSRLLAVMKEHKGKEEKDKELGDLPSLAKPNTSTLHKPLQEIEAPKSTLGDQKGMSEPLSDLRTPTMTAASGSGASDSKKSSKAGGSDIILLSDDEQEESGTPPSKRVKEAPETQLAHSNDIVNSDSCVNNLVATSSMTNIAGMGERLSYSSISECMEEDHPNKKSHFHHPADQTLLLDSHSSNRGKFNTDDGKMKLDSDGSSALMHTAQTTSDCRPGSQNNLDRYYRQKGPRIAKVVRRINCNVEPLELGVVKPGKLWCDTRAIYPKGFKSRVRYINAIDPTDMCYYVSEILDAGRGGPLFMVSMENCPSEVFAHTSASRSWEMVRERVNLAITKQHKLGKMNLHPLQPPGSLDGMELFGFFSPAIVQVIEAMDKNRLCTEYWKSRPLMQIPQHSQSAENSTNTSLSSEISNDNRSNESPNGINMVINGLFKKANPEELHALLGLFNNDLPNTNQGTVSQLLEEEINSRLK
ncbi:histone modifying enzyme [Lithospermum erythrorhizon]|uniref:Histone modifying enzyme n=1 Tax=Lithospermum erythrorhizon TaxID=34254 RepID=A0AAV3PJR7_LITER